MDPIPTKQDDYRKQYVTCQNCDAVNITTATFCRKCGQKFQIFKQLSAAQTDPRADTVPIDVSEPVQPTVVAPPPLTEYEPVPPQDATLLWQAPPPTKQEMPTPKPSITMTRAEMKKKLEKLQVLSQHIEDYFPADLPAKKGKLETWKQQIARAQACLTLLDDPFLQEPALKQTLDRSSALAEAIHALDFTREYTVKLIGPAGAGKSTLLTAMLGQDILPTGFGSAVTAIRTYIRLCGEKGEEKLDIHFLTRQAFDKLLAEAETKKDVEQEQRKTKQQRTLAAGLSSAPESDKEGPYTVEWKKLLYLRDTVDSKNGKTYVDTYLQRDKPLTFARDQWRTEGINFIIEPTDKSAPCLARLVDSAEFTLRKDKHSLLPEGSVWVDLPGGSAGQIAHDTILQKELQELDAIILVARGPRYDEEPSQKIFTQVYEEVWKKRGHSAAFAAGKIFVAAARWDEIATDDDTEGAVGGMLNLVRTFPATYRTYHHLIPVTVKKKQEMVPFYPLSAFDARMAMLGLQEIQLDMKQQQEATLYKGHITTAYNQLKLLDDTLPTDFTAQNFEDFPHKAMLKHSGMEALTSDLQAFLTERRFNMQLQDAIEQLNRVFQQIEDACWNYMKMNGFKGRDLNKLKNEMLRRKNRVKQFRITRINQLLEEMSDAWQKAIVEYDRARKHPMQYNSLYQALSEVQKQAIEHMNWRIDNREFDPYIDAANYNNNEEVRFSWAISSLEEFTQVDRKGLRAALRSNLGSLLEQMVQEMPATVLADMFLTTIEEQGRGHGGALDIERIAFGEQSEELEQIQQDYDELIDHLRTTAREVCRYVIISEYIDEERILKKDNPLMTELAKLDAEDQISGNSNLQAKTPEATLELGREIMKRIVVALSTSLIEHTYQRMSFIYRYELEKQQETSIYDTARPDMPPVKQDGKFREIKNRLFTTLTSLLEESPTFSAKVDGLGREIIDFASWADFIEGIKKQKQR